MPNHSPDREPTEVSAILIVAHPPERRHRRSNGPAQAGDCTCCCCCCCLHSLGGLIGAALAPGYFSDPEPPAKGVSGQRWYKEEDFATGAATSPAGDQEAVTTESPSVPTPPAEPFRYSFDVRRIVRPTTRPWAVGLFWGSFLLLLPLAVGVAHLWSEVDDLLINVIIVLLALPAVQVVAAVLAGLILLFVPCADKDQQVAQLVRIVLGVIAGTLLGLVLMTPLLFICR